MLVFLNKVEFEGEKIMSETKKFVMTYEGVKKLEDELEFLKSVKRKARKSRRKKKIRKNR